MLNRIKNSISERFVRPYSIKNFHNTKYGRQMQTYHNRYQGKRCFLIGNGPSLKADDLTKLHQNGEITFAFNRIYNIFDQTPWRPDFYISQDEKMLKGCEDVVSALRLSAKFIPIQLNWYHNIEIDGAVYFNINWNQNDTPHDFLFSDDISREIFAASTGMYTAVQMAAYMGFSEIYFIGVDHHFQISQNNKGEIVVDNTVKDYFSDKYNPDKENLYIPNTEKSTLTYIAIKHHCDKLGIKVFNATRGGRLEVFERKDFDKLF